MASVVFFLRKRQLLAPTREVRSTGTRKTPGRRGERSSGQTYVRGGQTYGPGTNVRPRGTYVWPKTVDTANMEAVISKSLLGLVVKVLDLKPDGKLKTNVGYNAGAV